MNRIILDRSAANQLANCSTSAEQFEVLDPAGQILGYFSTHPLPSQKDQDAYDWLRAAISDEELDRRNKEPLGRTTVEVLARLHSV